MTCPVSLSLARRVAATWALGFAASVVVLSPSLAVAQDEAALPSVSLPPPLARVLTDYERAWGARDPQALANLFTEDGFVLSSGRPPVRGRLAIARYYATSGGTLHLRALAYATEGKTGYIIGAYRWSAGEPDTGKFTLTLRKGADGRWLIASDMDNGNSRPGSTGAADSARSSADPGAIMQKATDDWNRGDLDAFVAPYHPDATFMTRRGPIDRAAMRSSYERNYFAGGKPKQQLRYEQLTTVPLAPDVALMTGRFILSGGEQPEQSGWFTLIWVRTPAGWQIVRDHTS